jgi:CubicO group peptidase (beta-lactamase class C family)
VTDVGEEEPPMPGGPAPGEIAGLWERTEELYRTGVHPAIQLCIRHRGAVVLDRAIGHASGNTPNEAEDRPKRRVTTATPIGLFSASKAITAMVIHKLDELDELRLDDRVCDYIPEFARHGKQRITIRHVLGHRAGLPNLPSGALDLDLLSQPERTLEILCDARLQTRPGRLLAYHAVTGGFILAEVAHRATGRDIRALLRTLITDPLDLRWMGYGVDEACVDEVAENVFTGPTPPPPLSTMLDRALGTSVEHVVELSNDRRFLTGIIPSANIVTTARETTAFFQCLLDEGTHAGESVFAPRTVRHAIAEQSWWEMDLTLMVPLRYSLGFMLGNQRVGPFGLENPLAFGHLGLSNVFCWADPERDLAVALLTTGKPIVSPHVVPLLRLIGAIGDVFPRRPRGGAGRT